MNKYKCKCGNIVFFYNYRIRLDGSITIRVYKKECDFCDALIEFTDIISEDLVNQVYVC